jgi:4-diphosphocytidyl-2-C-methyl-D-erythritol kinase
VRLRTRAPGKVNLCLFLGGTREDGRHQLVTLFESVSMADELVLETLPDGPDQVVCPAIDGPNLVGDAVAELRARGWAAPPVRIEIDKRVPIAAGMGGGSADAAAALRMAQLIDPVPDEVVRELAASLGADVPSQLVSGVTLGTGAGEIVEPRESLAPHAFVIVPLPFRLSTPAVYAEADRLGLPRADGELEARLGDLRDALATGAALPEPLLVNDLEGAAVSLCPPVSEALDAVCAAGADRALVCGSGPTVAGLCWGADADRRADEAARTLAEAFPAATPAAPVGPAFGAPDRV